MPSAGASEDSDSVLTDTHTYTYIHIYLKLTQLLWQTVGENLYQADTTFHDMTI